ncbi:MAG: DUF4139 domain-containing protein [Deltaproteobacteria bacterium]|nr:DUF4139 domain-containing protein [Deltaproteobacteria bacterium]
MKKSFLLTSLTLLILFQPAFGETKQAAVSVRKVVLFTSGVGYFEHAGTITGNSSTELRFKTEQINDILKSLVLEDLNGGKVGTVVYPSQDPLAKTLRSFQVDISDNPSLARLLGKMRGAKIKVSAHGEDINGAILGVEAKQKSIGEKERIVETWALNIISGASIRSISLDDVQKIELEDAELQAELNKAMTLLAQSRDKDKKPVLINFSGQGERRVRLGYVVETPVWKTSYRLILPADTKDKAHLQGWAIVENQTDNDWNNVQLSLVSGRPISFVYDLYQPLYLPRPVVQPKLYTGLSPRMYEGGMELPEEVEAQSFGAKEEGAVAEKKMLRQKDMAKAGAFASAPMISAQRAEPIDATRSIVSLAEAGKIGELFQYTVANVSLPRQQSAMIPIITDDITAERVSIYNQNVLPKNPLSGARLVNTTGKHLLQGPITVLDDNTYAGDAQIDDLPPGQERLLSYAIDMKVQIDGSKTTQEDTIETGKIVKGILHLQRKSIFTREYVVENKDDKEKVVIIEHPFRQGWKLADSPKPVGTTDRLYRFQESVAAGKKAKLVVHEEIVQSETLAILPADFGQLEYYSRSGKIPQKVRDALAKAMEMKKAMTDNQRKIAEKQKEVADITQEQQRIRENMKTVNQTSQYYSRLLAKLNEQETKIEKLQAQMEQHQEAYDKQRKNLEDYLMNMSLE